MRILAFDTATRATAVALCDGEQLELEARDDPQPSERPTHATRLLPLIVELLARAGVDWEAIERIAVGVGPGTFTGLRIGIATARALAEARSIPIVGISTLQSLAVGAVGGGVEGAAYADAYRGPDAVIAVLDARRSEVFAAGWPAQSVLGEPVLAAQALAPEELAALVPQLGSSSLAVGDGAVEFRSVLERAGAVVPAQDSALHKVTAINHCRLAAGLRAGAPDDIHPEYLRLPDAEIARRSPGSR